ncbi:hypothetical protein BH11ARM2_BH11ARM2_18530 [soil metagenome]
MAHETNISAMFAASFCHDRPVEWSVDYGEGSRPCAVPHAWHLDADVRWEGPAVYRTRVEIGVYRFHGVSYRAEISLDGEPLLVHEGIWDAFDVAVSRAGELTVRVTKNGGPTFPVREVASGFLPYVYHTFGGIFREVEKNPSTPLEPPRAVFKGELPYVRGILHWGWYPEIDCPHPDEATIRRELEIVRDQGFNLVKFCLWLPPHRYLDLLREFGMLGWIELPIWAPAPERLEAMGEEIGRIVRQYRRHADVVPLWTVGCELSSGVPAEWRERMYRLVKEETGAMVKDNSGGAEMYGGDLREYGDFEDFHPYCDTPFYPSVLDSLQNGPRGDKPIFLGEFNDIDVHRDFPRLARERPYWTSSDPALNDQGVRWQYDLPALFDGSRPGVWEGLFDEERSKRLQEQTQIKATHMRKFVHEAVRTRPDFKGYVVTGIRDTPISSSGFIDDWEMPRFIPIQYGTFFSPMYWNSEECLFLIPWRRPPWVNGGNRPGWLDPLNHFEGELNLRIGSTMASPEIEWEVVLWGPHQTFRGTGDRIHLKVAGECCFVIVSQGVAKNVWLMGLWPKPDLAFDLVGDPENRLDGMQLHDGPTLSVGRDLGARVTILTNEGTVPCPFWREAGYETAAELWLDRFIKGWTGLSALLAISPDRVLAPEMVGDAEVLIRRIDMRTYEETAVLIRRRDGSLVTTLRPFGGLGCQPTGIANNPVGWNLLAALLDEARELS